MATITPIDRQTTVPFLLKLFYRSGAYHRLDEFSPSAEPPPHVEIYTWPSCSLRELSHLLTSALPSLLPDPAIGTRLAFRLIYADTRSSAPASAQGRYMSKELGSVVLGEGGLGLEDEAGGLMEGSLGGEPDKTLQDVKFVVGDYVSCAILPATANGSVAPPPSGPSRGGGRYGRGDFGGFERGGQREWGGYRGGRGGPRGGGGFGGPGMGVGLPNGEWRRGERVPEGPSGDRGDRGRGYGGGGNFGGGRGGRW